jgi:hypothetical protein
LQDLLIFEILGNRLNSLLGVPLFLDEGHRCWPQLRVHNVRPVVKPEVRGIALGEHVVFLALQPKVMLLRNVVQDRELTVDQLGVNVKLEVEEIGLLNGLFRLGDFN